MKQPELSKQALAAVDLLRRTGSSTFEIRCSDDQEPVVWMAISGYLTDARGRPVAIGDPNRYEVAASFTPEYAIFRLCDQIIDGGQCMHCHRPTGFDEGTDEMPLPEVVCWYQYDPELGTYRRSCEGDQA
jgi:hypothetical protein